jgi:ABC-type branched-subunit amino acid transport system substrate-binding protein
MPADDHESIAAARFARRLGARRVYVLHDGSVGPLYAFYFRREALRLGERVVGYAGWDGKPPAEQLARVVARNRPDAVYLCGLIDTGVPQVLAAIRHALGPKTPVIGCSGLLPLGLLFDQAGAAARGTYITLGGLAVQSLGPAGQEFLHDFAATQSGKSIDAAAVYAAQATEALLAAIARSDGTRASVVRQLRATVRSGPLAPFSIDGIGEPIPARTTVVRVVRPSRTNAVQSYEGATPVAVVAS